MGTVIYTDARCLGHEPGAMHPESPERLLAIHGLLEKVPVANTCYKPLREASREELSWVHDDAYLCFLEKARGQATQLDPDTSTSKHSHEAALLSAGGAVTAALDVVSGKTENAFVLSRPPGHHAEKNRAMGFCLFSNVALAAEAARRAGAERVMVIDFDVHHGNGTQSAFYERPDVLFMSVHQFPHYPGTGAPSEVGLGAGKGFTVNCGLPAGMGDAEYGALFHDVFLPIAHAYRPQVLLVSAGFDAHRADPLAGMRVTERGFAAMTSALKQLADECCNGKWVMFLEGGYDLSALAQSVHACVEVMASARSELFPMGVSAGVRAPLQASREALLPYWPGLR